MQTPPSATSGALAPTQPVIALCMVLWVASYLVPLYFLPITMFAGLWLAVLVWGLVASGGIQPVGTALPRSPAAFAVPAVLAVLAALALRHHPTEAALLLVAAGVTSLGILGGARPWLGALLLALAIAAGVNALIGWVQFLRPDLDFPLIAPLATPTRVTGNLRQPNQLASLCLLGLVSAIVLVGSGRWRRAALGLALAVLLGTALAFARSRTGWLGLALVVAWALFDRSLPRTARRLAVAALAGLALGFAALWLRSQFAGGDFYLHSAAPKGGDLSAQRFGIWANTLALIGQHPLTGVGWGNFGWAWALSEFPGRPVAFFDNTHNLPLQLLAELGIPLGGAVLAALAWALWRARGSWGHGEPAAAIESRGLWLVLALMGLHSLLEYPLWFSYFLLPTAFALGVLVHRGEAARAARLSAGMPPAAGEAAGTVAAPGARALQLFGVLVVAGSLYAAWDYTRVLQAFSPFGAGLRQSLEQRVATGRKSVLFGYWVEYGWVTNIDTFKGAEDAFARPLRNHVNSHLLMQYARALHERGEDDKAAYIAERLREFRHPVSVDFLAVCDRVAAGAPPPFQCARPQKSYRYTDFQ